MEKTVGALPLLTLTSTNITQLQGRAHSALVSQTQHVFINRLSLDFACLQVLTILKAFRSLISVLKVLRLCMIFKIVNYVFFEKIDSHYLKNN